MELVWNRTIFGNTRYCYLYTTTKLGGAGSFRCSPCGACSQHAFYLSLCSVSVSGPSKVLSMLSYTVILPSGLVFGCRMQLISQTM